MSNLLDADDVLHSALYFTQLIALAATGLGREDRCAIMRGAEAAREDIEKAIELINSSEVVQS